MGINVFDILNKEFQDKVAEDLKLSDDLELDASTNISKQHFYYQILVECKKERLKLIKQRDKVYCDVYSYYKYEDNRALSENEIKNIYLPADERYRVVKFALDKVEDVITTLEDIVKLFQQRNFAIKNIIDLRKLEGF